MKIITRKSEIEPILKELHSTYKQKGLDIYVQNIYKKILVCKVKFPILEHVANDIYMVLPKNEHINFCDRIEELKTEGGNVILGIMLQNRLNSYFDESFKKATEYISRAHVWYICDIIGERVYGYSLLKEPKNTISQFERLSKHNVHWVQRALGAGGHYAIKKGLDKVYVIELFKMLLSMANTMDKEIRQGVGWAAKTTAKFHPDIIETFQIEINNTQQVAHWFRKKVEIGLERNKHAKGN